jgi:hypothetical protein
MARKPNMPATGGLQDQSVTSAMVEDAWQAFRSTQLAARDNPALTENEYFCAIQDTAYARFLLLLEAL